MSDRQPAFVERILERGARAMRGGALHPAEILAAIEDAVRAAAHDGLAPNQVIVTLSASDYAALEPSVDEFREGIEQQLDGLEEQEGWGRLAPRIVVFQPSPGVDRGDVAVAARFADTVYRPREQARGDTVRIERVVGLVLVVDEGARVPITHTPFTIGRASWNDLPLANLAVSRTHARIISTPQGLAIEDLGSRNGVLVDGVPRQAALLKPGSTVRLGDVHLWVEEE